MHYFDNRSLVAESTVYFHFNKGRESDSAIDRPYYMRGV